MANERRTIFTIVIGTYNNTSGMFISYYSVYTFHGFQMKEKKTICSVTKSTNSRVDPAVIMRSTIINHCG